jgi:hypothetical protein
MTRRLRARLGDAEEGVITAFVVVIGVALMLFAGLVYDGGMALRAKVDAVDEASAAARAGAQQLDLTALRSTGAVTLDAPAAEVAAEQYLATIGRSGTVTVNGDEVSVIVSFRQPTDLLGIAGIGSFAVSGSGSATATEGP